MRTNEGILPALPLFLISLAARAEDGSGDVFVVAKQGASITIDGAPADVQAPGVVRRVPTGPHTIRVVHGCEEGTAAVEVRENAIERVAVELQPGTGSLSLVTAPAGATVRAGEQELGETPLDSVELPCGPLDLRLSADGYFEQAVEVAIPLGGNTSLQVKLEVYNYGAVAFNIAPLEAEIVVDGELRGSGPMTVDKLRAGPHHVVVRLDGYLPYESEVVVQQDQVVRVNAALDLVPPPAPFAERVGLDRVPWGRLVLNTGVTGFSAGLGYLALDRYNASLAAYDQYLQLTYQDDHEGFYAESVDRPRSQSQLLVGAAGAALAGAGVLWVTTSFGEAQVSAGPAGVRVGMVR